VTNDILRQIPANVGDTVYSSYVGLFMTLLILFTGGFRVFTKGNWDPVGFVSSYLCVSFKS
jgi:amino acid transporter